MGAFVDRYGAVRWTPHLGRRYPRDGACEVCGRTPAELAAEYAEDRNKHLGVLMFDHCHAHGWVRGLLCLGCNNDMVLFDKGLPAASSPRRTAYARNCPDCCYAATLLAAIQHSQGK